MIIIDLYFRLEFINLNYAIQYHVFRWVFFLLAHHNGSTPELVITINNISPAKAKATNKQTNKKKQTNLDNGNPSASMATLAARDIRRCFGFVEPSR